MNKLYYNSILLISLLAVFGAAVYRFYQLNYPGVFLTLILTIIALIILNKIHKVKAAPSAALVAFGEISSIKRLGILYIAAYAVFLCASFILLFRATTSESIISPWQIVPWYFFLTFAIATFFLLAIIFKTKLPLFICFMLHASYLILIFSVALIIYGIGCGFDPFIHQATEKLIDATGAVYPKPWYYLGQYALIVILHKLTFIPIIWLDKLLVPVLAALTLPFALYQAIKSLGADKRVAKLTALFTLIFPFTIFIVTTPQNLANLFLILIILLSLNNNLHASLALAALVIHPIAGIPALLFTSILLAKKYITSKKILNTSYFILYALSIFALPAAFYLNNKTSSIINAPAAETSVSVWHLPQFWFSGQETFLLNFIYLYGFNIGLIAASLIIAGIIIYYKKILDTKYPARPRSPGGLIQNTYILMSISLFISYFITKTINFNYLIDYEQSNFSGRILQIAAFFSLPFILLALSQFISAILEQGKIIKYSFVCFLVFLACSSFYISYPRFDNYFNSRGYSTSQADIEAVRWIEDNSPDDNFIVLANQQVSAAALYEFGFKKYYPSPSPNGRGGAETFYYPIPTGGELYQYYLKMVYKKADKKTALEAANLVNTDTAYFVLNSYWWAFDKILAEARMEADETASINNGSIYIFKYVNPVE
ncbi:hypothetical protein COT99_00490 [Candidatus Falkowbacteria bacterium CG10_big_fil_rev_8_21_14_0_10_43_10]|uniref:Glycosyltransferase RgtA/B/C/D-like domain-containing protein n=1 Tax=Candidatus Falkowbacteria bacterium CG10_big_fil_rev_8_21_14_0_10_43_10 TaxID=1974567 RepID=A0A2H0V4Y3_9BACT|nr:MAG: hypothetical protein COT99_00490 [Candidatus Falkowbacteria bacterium CG10_big_fil_rev_8_21_14_0_10_43_10]